MIVTLQMRQEEIYSLKESQPVKYFNALFKMPSDNAKWLCT
jgi:hypothetical protein